jgi:alpha-beta hydrolase superfamily lysophospholipase
VNQTSSRVRPFIWRCARKTLRLCLVIYFAAAVGCAVVQRKLIYFPTTAPAAELDEFAVKYGLERWKNGVGENIGWRRKSPTQPPRGRVLITHGNGGYAMHRLNFAEPLRQSAGMDVFILEYPGYGDRAGQSSEKSFFAAAAEAFQSLPKTVPIYLMGESLGTGPACHLAGTHSNDVAGVLLLAPYNSLVDVAQHHVVILPASLILRDRFESEK